MNIRKLTKLSSVQMRGVFICWIQFVNFDRPKSLCQLNFVSFCYTVQWKKKKVIYAQFFPGSFCWLFLLLVVITFCLLLHIEQARWNFIHWNYCWIIQTLFGRHCEISLTLSVQLYFMIAKNAQWTIWIKYHYENSWFNAQLWIEILAMN